MGASRTKDLKDAFSDKALPMPHAQKMEFSNPVS
jgi:hypothetical protein